MAQIAPAIMPFTPWSAQYLSALLKDEIYSFSCFVPVIIVGIITVPSSNIWP